MKSVTVALHSTSEVCRQVPGLSLRQITYWRMLGAVVPAIGAEGSGTRVRWSDDDIARLKAIVAVQRHLRSINAVVMKDGIAKIWDALTLDGVYRLEGLEVRA